MRNRYKYLLLIVSGFLIILVCSLFHKATVVQRGEYYYSRMLSSNYTIAAKIIFFLAGLAVGYYWKLNPWIAGISLFLVFPLTSVIEAAVYPGSHNLIPFEFAFHFVLALPAIIAVFIGRFIKQKVSL